jgi:inner membrane protein
MDSLTQIVLGASVGAAVGRKKYGKKSALIGAFIGTIPDLDVLFLNHLSPIENMTIHRGWSHSLLFIILATPIFAWVVSKIKFFRASFRDKTLHFLIFLTFLTHIILDAMTIYGTQIFWPLSTPPAGIGSIFIIDLLYTLPLLISLIWFLATKSKKAILIGLTVSSVYLFWSFIAQQIIEHKVTKNYDGIIQQILIQPTPFNTVLWRILIIEDETYKVGYYSLFDEKKEIQYKRFPLNKNLEPALEDSYGLQRMGWFTMGFYALKEVDNQIVLSDLRMGLEPNQYVFQFVIGERQKGEIIPVPNRRYNADGRNLERLKKVWRRIWDEDIAL